MSRFIRGIVVRAKRSVYRSGRAQQEAAVFKPLEALEPRVLLSAVVDPGNTLDTSRALGTVDIDVVTIKGFVGGTDAGDIYNFSVARPSYLQIALSGLSKDARVRVITDTNNNGQIDDSEIVISGDAGKDAPITLNTNYVGNNNFIQIIPNNGNAKTAYKLTITHPRVDPINPTLDAYESDDVSATAGTIIVGGVQTHAIETPDDVDWQKFTIDATTRVTAKTDGTSGDTELRLYAASDLINSIAYDNDSGAGKFSQITATLQPGTYFLRVNENGSNATIKRYKLSVTATPTPTPPVVKVVPPNSRPLGSLLGTRTVSDQLGGSANNLADLYSFSVSRTEAVQIKVNTSILGWETAIFDTNGNRVSPSVVSNVVHGDDADTAVFVLSPGNYFLAFAEPQPIFSTIELNGGQAPSGLDAFGNPTGFGDILASAALFSNTGVFGSLITTTTGTPRASTTAPPVQAYTLTLRAVLVDQMATLK